jgi:hypothetical protein
VIGCSQGKQDPTDSLDLAQRKLDKIGTQETAEQEQMTNFSVSMDNLEDLIKEIKKTSPEDPQGRVDLSTHTDDELQAIAVDSKKLIVPEVVTSPQKPQEMEVAPPPTNIPPKRQALIYRIAAYFKQIFKKKVNK